jgi:hypothetical protein
MKTACWWPPLPGWPRIESILRRTALPRKVTM